MRYLRADAVSWAEVQAAVRPGAVVSIGRGEGTRVFVRVLRAWRWRGAPRELLCGYLQPGEFSRLVVAMPGGVPLELRADAPASAWRITGVMVP